MMLIITARGRRRATTSLVRVDFGQGVVKPNDGMEPEDATARESVSERIETSGWKATPRTNPSISFDESTNSSRLFIYVSQRNERAS